MMGARVRQVRELLGWTQTELAERAGTDQRSISAIESGTRREGDSERLDRIAACTGFDRGWFETDRIYDELPSGTIRFRKKATASKKDDRRAIRRLEVAEEIVEILARDRRLLPVTLPFVGPAIDRDSIEQAADTVRTSLELPATGPIRNLIRAVERSGAVVVGLPVETGSTDRVRNHHGVSAWPDTDRRPVIGYSASDPGDRQRHTLGHEVGHLVLHRGNIEDHRHAENQASQFAGALLMPYQDARAAFDVGVVTLRHLAELKRSWGISIAGLVMRAAFVGAINDARKESLFKQISARGWRTKEPVVVHREQPALLPRLLEAKFGQPIDWSGAGRALGVPPHLIRELACISERDRAIGESLAEVHQFRRSG
jgi:Zn-dependent peptidase ImmA (M78 family)/DNA-binding XRE family transcriptional regulator